MGDLTQDCWNMAFIVLICDLTTYCDSINGSYKFELQLWLDDQIVLHYSFYSLGNMVNGRHLYSTFNQSIVQLMLLIHPFTHSNIHTFTHMATMQGNNQHIWSN